MNQLLFFSVFLLISLTVLSVRKHCSYTVGSHVTAKIHIHPFTCSDFIFSNIPSSFLTSFTDFSASDTALIKSDLLAWRDFGTLDLKKK